jgi:type III pantothenate kinase
MPAQPANILAIEVGSSRVKVGWFPAGGACADDKAAAGLPVVAAPRTLPEPSDVFRVEHKRDERAWTDEITSRLQELPLPGETICALAAVHRPAASALEDRVLKPQLWSRIVKLTSDDVPIEANLPQRFRVGVDRLLNSLAANRLRQPDRPAIVVDVGTAMTVNLIDANGVFQGGAILPGPMTALAALHSATSSLPLLDREALNPAPSKAGARGRIAIPSDADSSAMPPPVVGKFTEEAMAAGAYWGAVGAARELIARMAATCDRAPEVFLTGGASGGLEPHIGLGDEPARHVPHLVLSGIRLAADEVLAR